MKRLSAEQKAEAVRLRQAGSAYRDIAALFGVSEKTVQRTLKASGQFDKPASYYRLKPQKQRLVAGLAKGLSPRQAAVEAGYSDASARSGGLVGPEEERALEEVLRQEIPSSLIAERLRQGVDAVETRFFAHEGHVVTKREVVDYGQRRQYLELAAKLRRDIKDAPTVTVPVQLVFEGGEAGVGAVAAVQPAAPAGVRLGMRPNSEQQRRFIDAGEIEQLFGGAKRGGKTVAGSIKAVLLSVLFPGNRGLIARRNFPDLRDSTMATFLRVCPPELILEHAKGEKRIVLRTAGGAPSEILYRGLGDAGDFEKVKGLDLGWCWIDEPSEVPEEVFLMLRAQLNWVLPDGTRPRYMAMLTSNPEPGWVKRRYIDRMIPGGVYIRALPADNPDLPAGWETDLRATMDAEWVQKYLDGSWNVGENSVFTALDETRHAIEDVDPAGMRIVVALDHATTGWTAALVVGIDADENAFALEEYYQRDRLVSEHAREILQLLACYPRAEYTLIDPSTEARTLQGPHELYSVLDEYRRHGLHATPAHRASIDIGINLIREYLHASPLHRHPMRPSELGAPRLFIVKRRCPNLWQEMQELRREVKDTGRIEYKGRDHATDCLRYLLMSRPRAAERRALDVARMPPQERHALQSHERWARQFDGASRGSESWF